MVDKSTRRGFRESMRLLFEDLSFAQVAAGALAAVTSMLFASQIGIAGSVIGAAVGSVVATVSSQVYKKFINASAEKIKVIPASVGMASAAPDAAASAAEAARTADASEAEAEPKADASTATGSADTPPVALADDADASAYSNPALYRARAAERMRRQRRRCVIVVAVLSSVLAVLASALLVYALTAGEGLGTKPETVWSPSASERATARLEGPHARTDDAAPSADETAGAAPSTSAPEAPAAPSAPSSSSSAAASSSSASSAASSSSSASSAASSSSASSSAADSRG